MDTSALMKLVVADTESEALTDFLESRDETPWCTAALTRAELVRAAAQIDPRAVDDARQVLAGLDTVTVTDRLLDTAVGLEPATLTVSEAIHLAAALTAGPLLESFVSYDKRLLDAARLNRIPTVSPGGAA
ncbi:type II toxin-antitoxin system VapC family toxin [Mycobacteroides abscessus]|uniref:type II toxin-antitoxin system VapC family toxin n=1 Tax=Mycobacteroides abscessus TaxID=36809 RepID=UPI001F37725B|nr:type II toxin-antitoxin system VapC family toxin [Mycobacteroides abscessus]